ncbi:MAG: Rieske 2Fe-2S domain-containing protein [Thiobacillaceae bacterium]
MVDEALMICESDRLREGGQGIRFDVSIGGQNLPAFVVRFKGKPRAYLNQCGHVPVELDWLEGAFFDADGTHLICSTHGALYNPATGQCISGRCNGNGLTPLNVVEENNRIFLAPKSKT